MKKHLAFLYSVLFSMLWCGVVGLIRTRYASLHLLEKNKALLESGRVALPGAGHIDTLASWAPAFAGALFFALALGVGYGAVSFLYGYQWRRIPRRFWSWAALPLAILPFVALYRNEWDTHVALTLAGATGVIFGLKAEGEAAFDRKKALTAVLAAILIAIGFLPWATAREGAFTRIRDTVLLNFDALRPVSDFYYRWTLYPAEAIKPVDIRTQPGAAVEEKLRAEFCPSAWQLGIVCMPPGAGGYDFVVKPEAENAVLVSGSARMVWDYSSMEANAANFKNFGDATDTARILRRSTAISLTWLLPLAILAALSYGCLMLGRNNPTYAVIAAFAIAAATGYLGMAGSGREELDRLANGGSSFEEVSAALNSPYPVKRLYGAVAAGRDPEPHSARLMRALTDPVVNVRYNAALSLGGLRTEEAKKRLSAILASDEEWYVKFRAYSALAQLGWMN